MFADEINFISSASFPQPSPMSQLISTVRIFFLKPTSRPEEIQFTLKPQHQSLRVFNLNNFKAQTVTRPTLCDERKIHRNHGAESRISTRSLVIRHKDDQ